MSWSFPCHQVFINDGSGRGREWANLVLHSSQASYSSKTFPPFLFSTGLDLGWGMEMGAMKPQTAHLGTPLGLLVAAVIVSAICARRWEEGVSRFRLLIPVLSPKHHFSLPPQHPLSRSPREHSFLIHLPGLLLHCICLLLSLLLLPWLFLLKA